MILQKMYNTKTFLVSFLLVCMVCGDTVRQDEEGYVLEPANAGNVYRYQSSVHTNGHSESDHSLGEKDKAEASYGTNLHHATPSIENAHASDQFSGGSSDKQEQAPLVVYRPVTVHVPYPVPYVVEKPYPVNINRPVPIYVKKEVPNKVFQAAAAVEHHRPEVLTTVSQQSYHIDRPHNYATFSQSHAQSHHLDNVAKPVHKTTEHAFTSPSVTTGQGYPGLQLCHHGYSTNNVFSSGSSGYAYPVPAKKFYF